MPGAYVSVSEKESSLPLVRFLKERGWWFLATEGTGQYIRKETGISCSLTSHFTMTSGLLGGRIKSIHPRIVGAVLARPEDAKDVQTHHIPVVDIAIVNFHPFGEKVRKGHSFEDCLSDIDIGGPVMVCAAARNCANVAVLVDSRDHQFVMDEVAAKGTTTLATRKKLAAKALEYVAEYQLGISNWMSKVAKK